MTTYACLDAHAFEMLLVRVPAGVIDEMVVTERNMS